MLHIRIVKTKGISRAVQVYRYQNSKRVIIKHIGSGTSDEQINSLVEMERLFISDYTKHKSQEVKYLKSGNSNMVLNEKLIEKTTKLLGIEPDLIVY